MSRRADYLSALRTDIVRVLCEHAGSPEPRAVRTAERIIETMRMRYEGKDIRFGRKVVTREEVMERFNGRNRSQVCRDLGISRSTFYRLIKG